MDAWIRVAAPRTLLRVCEERGIASAAVLAAAGIAELPAEPHARVPYRVHAALFGAAARLVDDPALPIVFAQALPDGSYDVAEFAARSAPDVGAALRTMIRYQRLYSSASTFVLDARDDGSARVWMRPSGPLPIAARLGTESALAQTLRQIRIATGQRVVPAAVTFRHAAPRAIAAHEAFFGCRPIFEAPVASLELGAADFARHCVRADGALHRFLVDRGEESLRTLTAEPSGLRTDVWREIEALLPSGEASVERIARRLGRSERSLRRALEAEGVTYRELVDEVRLDLARRYLKDERASIDEIAFLLDFADARAFRRAFRRWTGTTPAEARSRV